MSSSTFSSDVSSTSSSASLIQAKKAVFDAKLNTALESLNPQARAQLLESKARFDRIFKELTPDLQDLAVLILALSGRERELYIHVLQFVASLDKINKSNLLTVSQAEQLTAVLIRAVEANDLVLMMNVSCNE